MSEFHEVEDSFTLSDLTDTGLQDKEGEDNHENRDDPGDPCNSYAWHVVFCLLFTLAIVFWMLVYLKIIRSKTWGGLDRIFLLLGVSTLVQFGPMLTATIHAGQGPFLYTQTGCKLMFYTEYGTRHVISVLVVSAYLYAHLGLRHGFQSIDRKLKDWFGWSVLLLLAIQGLFGMVPAMYVDVHAKSAYRTYCIWTRSMELTSYQVRSMELVMRPLTPYLVPGLAILLTEIVLLLRSKSSLHQLSKQVTEPNRVSMLATVRSTVLSFFILNSGYAVILLVEFSLMMTGQLHNRAALCNTKWFLFVIHQFWFIVAPSLYLNQYTGDLSGGATVKDRIRSLATVAKSKAGASTVNQEAHMEQETYAS